MSVHGNDKNPDINQRLETIIGILLNQSKLEKMTLGDKINYLSKQGYDNREIAKIFNTTPNLVSKEKSLAKKAKQNE